MQTTRTKALEAVADAANDLIHNACGLYKDKEFYNPSTYEIDASCILKLTDALQALTKEKEEDYLILKPSYYRHFKGTLYKAFSIIRHTETEERLVVYGENQLDWGRPIESFIASVVVDGQLKPRFEYLPNHNP